MRKNDFSNIIKFSVILVLIAAMALCMVSCDGLTKETDTNETVSETAGSTEKESPKGTENEEVFKYSITVEVIDDEGKSTEFKIDTNKETLADALLEAKLVEGEESQYGLYIKYVNGIRADYELDGAYWSLSKDGEMLLTGASETKIANGEKYELTYTK